MKRKISGITPVETPVDVKKTELQAFIFYCVTFVGCGAVITGLGPLIPFFAEREGRLSTDYAFLFFWRATGYGFGSILCKVWERYYSFHQICYVGSIVMCFSLLAFSWAPGIYAKALILLMASIMNATLDIFVNMCII